MYCLSSTAGVNTTTAPKIDVDSPGAILPRITGNGDTAGEEVDVRILHLYLFIFLIFLFFFYSFVLFVSYLFFFFAFHGFCLSDFVVSSACFLVRLFGFMSVSSYFVYLFVCFFVYFAALFCLFFLVGL